MALMAQRLITPILAVPSLRYRGRHCGRPYNSKRRSKGMIRIGQWMIATINKMKTTSVAGRTPPSLVSTEI